MSNYNYNILLRINSELQLAYDFLYEDIAFLIALSKAYSLSKRKNPSSDSMIKKAFENKESLDLILDYRNDTSSVVTAIKESEVISSSGLKAINQILEYQKMHENIRENSFSPFSMDEEFEFQVEEFIFRLLVCYRTKSYIRDITNGMLDYGREAYLVNIENDDFDLLKSLEDMELENMMDELLKHIDAYDDLDGDDEQIQKEELGNFIIELNKMLEEQEN